MAGYNTLEGDREKVTFSAQGGRRPTSRKCLCLVVVMAAVVTFIIGIIIGVSTRGACAEPEKKKEKPPEGKDAHIAEKIVAGISPQRIGDFLKRFTSYPHLAGTAGSKRLADDLKVIWTQQGLDSVQQVTYDVLLSYPNVSDPNVFRILDGQGKAVFRSQLFEKPLDPEQGQQGIVPPFNSYSPPGDVTGDVVFVNYGRIEDFQYLEREHKINFTNKICLIKYGKLFRANKVRNAQNFGAAGVLLYTDPKDYSGGSVDQNKAYPHTWWMPDTGVQRGTVFVENGDPLTPFYPSTGNAYRRNIKDTTLSKIPATPVSYGDAGEILKRMRGPAAPAGWAGGIPLTYRVGPGLLNTSWSVNLHVSTDYRQANVTTVVGYIRGSEEPDRYVVLGNHRDAWVFGAADPTSGTAAMMEVSRVLGDLVRKGWRPRRSILFCSWGAEEYGLVGSFEWVEDFIKNLGNRAVANLNVDIAVEGNYSLRVNGVPLMHDVVYKAANQITWPQNGKTVYDDWLQKLPKTTGQRRTDRPEIGMPGGGSDHEGFIAVAGVPVIDLRTSYDPALGLSSYPMYHSAYETYHYQSEFVDRGFKMSQVVCQIWGLVTHALADSALLPLSIGTYSTELQAYVTSLHTRYRDLLTSSGVSFSKSADDVTDDVTSLHMRYRDLLSGSGVSFTRLYREVQLFQQAVIAFQGELNKPNQTVLELRMLNDKLMQVERAFVDPRGVPHRPEYRHLVHAPSAVDQYSGAAFPGLADLLYTLKNTDNSPAVWRELKEHLAAVEFAVRSATSSLLPDTGFVRD